MTIVGTRRILGPRDRVWQALHEHRLLGLLGGGSITETGPDIITVADHNSRTELALRADEADATLLDYTLSADDTPAKRAELDRFLALLQEEASGPVETGASLSAAVTDAFAQPIRSGILPTVPRQIFGLPGVLVLGSVIFLLILFTILHAYV